MAHPAFQQRIDTAEHGAKCDLVRTLPARRVHGGDRGDAAASGRSCMAGTSATANSKDARYVEPHLLHRLRDRLQDHAFRRWRSGFVCPSGREEEIKSPGIARRVRGRTSHSEVGCSKPPLNAWLL